MDGNNFLEKNELKGLLQKAAPPKYVVNDDDCTYIIGKCDVDQDGRISLDELGPAVAAWMANCKAIAARGPPPSEKGGELVRVRFAVISVLYKEVDLHELIVP